MKKLAKILIAVFAVALVVSALAVVISAADTPAPQANTVKLSVNGEDVNQALAISSLDSTLAALTYNEEGKTEISIKLLGDCSRNYYDFQDNKVLKPSNVTIDLNGYQMSGNHKSNAEFFIGANANVTITGSGDLHFNTGSSGNTAGFAYLRDGATFSIRGTGDGININTIHPTGTAVRKVCKNFLNLGSNTNFNLENVKFTITNEIASDMTLINLLSGTTLTMKDVDFNVSYSKSITTSAYVPEDDLILVNNGAKLVMENTNFTYDVALVPGALPDGTTTYADAGLFGVYFASLSGTAQMVVKNSQIKTATSGLKFTETTGASYAGLDANKSYVAVFEGSSLTCINDNARTVELLKKIGKGSQGLRNVLFNSNTGSAVSKGEVYFKNSYAGGNFRMISAKQANSTTADSIEFTFDNSTVEWMRQIFDLTGLSYSSNGEGFMSVGGTYMNFINGAKIDLGPTNLTAGGSANSGIEDRIKGTLQGVIEGGQWCIDLAEGTRVNKAISSVDIPSGMNLAYDPNGDAEFPYVVTANYANYVWGDLAGEVVYSVAAVAGNDMTVFNDEAYAAIKDTVANLNVLTLVPDGTWTLEGTTFTCGKKVAGVNSDFKASVGMTVHQNFDINFMVDANSYNYLDDATKALFTQVGDYYVVTESAERAVNQAFTKANYDLVIVDGDYTYTAHYEASIVDYVARNFAEGSVATAENKAIAYYIAAYLNSAYAHFTTTDEPSADDLAALAAIVTAQSENYATGLTPDVGAGDYSALSDKGVEIAIDLKSTPKYVITSATYAGTVKFNGVTTSFAAGETVELSASVLNFDNALTITLQDADNSTGTYSLANYVENTLANESYSEELKALVVAFSDYVIYAENFRA